MISETSHRCQDRRDVCPTSNIPRRPQCPHCEVGATAAEDTFGVFVVRSQEKLVTQLLQQAARKSLCGSRLPRLLFSSVVYLRYIPWRGESLRQSTVVPKSFQLHHPALFFSWC